MKGLRNAALAAVAILLAAAHVAYWYWPREHAGSPGRGSTPAAALAAGDLPLRAWVAFPHQNLAFLTTGERGENWRRGLADLAGLPPIQLPRFGPFALPPASELAVATDREGARLVVAARIYPAISWVARAAGRVAGNPWLAGGAIVEGGRTLEVEWRGRDWILRRGVRSESVALPRGAALDPSAVLARFALAEPVGAFPPGVYRLRREGPDLDMRTLGAGGGPLVEPTPGVLLLTERRAGGLRASAVLGPGQGSLRGLPSSVALAQRGVGAAPLPFERLYKLLRIKSRRERWRGWEVIASDDRALARGRELAPQVERAGGLATDLRFAYSVDLDVVRAVSDELERKLEGVPLPAIREIRQWRGAARLLAELRIYRRWTLEVTAQGEARSRLWRSD